MSDKLQGGILAGTTSVSLPVILRKTADNTENTGTVAAGVTAYYWRQGGTPTALTAATDLAAITSAFAAGGWKAADGTNAPGVYRLDVDNAAFASGADWVVITVKVANCFLFAEKYPLTSNVVQSGDNFARLGAPAGASIAADLAEIEGETDTLLAGVNVTQWNGHAVPAENISGVPLVDAKYLLGTVFATPMTAGLMDVNVKQYNAHTAVTDANNLPSVNAADYGGFTVQLGGGNLPAVDMLRANGTAVTGVNSGGAMIVDVRYWNNQVVPASNVNGVPLVDLKYTLGTLSPATPGYVAVSAYAANQDPATLVWAQAMTELTSVPNVTDTILHAMEWLFIVAHNKITETATTQLVRNNADAATIGTSTVSDDGTTFIRGKFA